MGLEVLGHPLFKAEPMAWVLPEGEFDALLIGSATVFRYGGAQLSKLVRFPVDAVGAATADTARAAGFAVRSVGEGGLQRVLDSNVATPLRYLRLGGEERVTLETNPGQTIIERAVYRMRPLAIRSELAAHLVTRQPLVTLHSAAAARHFASEIDRLRIERGRMFVLALGARIAKAAGLGWASLHVVDTPNDAALLAKAAALCK